MKCLYLIWKYYLWTRKKTPNYKYLQPRSFSKSPEMPHVNATSPFGCPTDLANSARPKRHSWYSPSPNPLCSQLPPVPVDGNASLPVGQDKPMGPSVFFPLSLASHINQSRGPGGSTFDTYPDSNHFSSASLHSHSGRNRPHSLLSIVPYLVSILHPLFPLQSVLITEPKGILFKCKSDVPLLLTPLRSSLTHRMKSNSFKGLRGPSSCSPR